MHFITTLLIIVICGTGIILGYEAYEDSDLYKATEARTSLHSDLMSNYYPDVMPLGENPIKVKIPTFEKQYLLISKFEVKYHFFLSFFVGNSCSQHKKHEHG